MRRLFPLRHHDSRRERGNSQIYVIAIYIRIISYVFRRQGPLNPEVESRGSRILSELFRGQH